MAVIIFRLEQPHKGYAAYAIDCDAAVNAVMDSYSSLVDSLPKPIKSALDSFLFAMRHGVVQSIFKQKHVDMIEFEPGTDKNLATIGHLAQLYFVLIQQKSIGEDGYQHPVDIPAKYSEAVFAGIISRIPEFDGGLYELPEPETAIEAVE